jgi:DNA-binding CsgD family transcriptional regulator
MPRFNNPPRDARVSELRLHGKRFLVLSFEGERVSIADSLTEAEAAVALLALQGLSNQEIAGARQAATRTVANQLASVYRKLGVGSRVELAALWAHQRGGRAR